ncbi:hypothetical protein K2X30_12225 [bacterium]|jgi:hypothetical protein|nr:hypothetical protein [bacterium]
MKIQYKILAFGTVLLSASAIAAPLDPKNLFCGEIFPTFSNYMTVETHTDPNGDQYTEFTRINERAGIALHGLIEKSVLTETADLIRISGKTERREDFEMIVSKTPTSGAIVSYHAKYTLKATQVTSEVLSCVN